MFFFISLKISKQESSTVYLWWQTGNEKAEAECQLSSQCSDTALNTISWDMYDILRLVSSCLRKRIWGDLLMIPLGVVFSFLFCHYTKLHVLDLNICMSLSIEYGYAEIKSRVQKSWTEGIKWMWHFVYSNFNDDNANVKSECQRTPRSLGEYQRWCAQMTKTFGPRVFGWLCKQMVHFTTASRQDNHEGHLQSQLFSTNLNHNTYSKSGAYFHKAIYRTKIISLTLVHFAKTALMWRKYESVKCFQFSDVPTEREIQPQKLNTLQLNRTFQLLFAHYFSFKP